MQVIMRKLALLFYLLPLVVILLSDWELLKSFGNLYWILVGFSYMYFLVIIVKGLFYEKRRK